MSSSAEPRLPSLARLSFWLLLLLVALAPLPFGANRPWAWSLLALCAAGLTVMWALAALVNADTVALSWGRYRPLFVLFAGFVAWSLYQALGPAPEAWWGPGWKQLAAIADGPVRGAISAAPERSMTAIMRLLSYAAVFWIAMQVGRRAQYARVALWMVALAGTIYAIYGLAVLLEGSNTILWFAKWSFRDTITSTFVNRNHFAVYAGLAILCTLTLIADETRRATAASVTTRSGFVQFLDNLSARLVILAFAFMVLATALILTQSRAGVFATAVGILVFLAVLATTSSFAARSVLRFGIIIVLAGGVFAAVSGSMLASRLSDLRENLGDRLIVYKTTLAAISERPFLGFGLGSFEDVFPLYRGAEFRPRDLSYDYAHNVFLELAFESGIPGALALIGLVALAAGVCAWGARNRQRNEFIPVVGVAATALVATHGMVDFALQIPAIAATYALLLGVAYSQAWATEGSAPEDTVREAL